jgi:Spy/CpxP family protein refolding chaperone
MKALLPVALWLSLVTLPAMAMPDDFLPGAKTMTQAGIAPDKAQKLRAIREQNHQAMEPLKAKMKTQRKALMDYLASPNATPQQAQQLSAQIDQTMQQMTALRLKAWFEMREHLTPEQMQKLVSARQQRMAEGRARWQQEHHGSHGKAPLNKAPQKAL